MAVGWMVVVGYALVLVIAAVGGARQQDRIERAPRPTSADERFVSAWERSRLATFVASGTFERRSTVTGARVASADVVAQRPPRRLHRQLGGVAGRDDDRLIVCPATPGGDGRAAACRLGAPGGPTYRESVAAEVDALGSLVGGPDALYTVRVTASGCFALEQQRVEPRAPFGVRSRFCFDSATGAPSGSRVEYDGGIVEVVAVTDIRSEATEADLAP